MLVVLHVAHSPRPRVWPLVALLTWLWAGGPTALLADGQVQIDFGAPHGRIRPLHGVNNGPLNQGETVDVSRDWDRLRIPVVRLHDCEWPTGQIADIHAMFPDPQADPTDPSKYDFRRTDAYLEPILRQPRRIVFRLGESIEHTRIKYHVHPPGDVERWASTCLGVIAHYHGAQRDRTTSPFQYWEVWNEPENRPAMWSGTDEDYFRLYVATARRIKQAYPELKVGGPAVGATGEVIDGRYQPTEFLQNFLKVCREQQAPLDFFSWHTYTNDPAIYVAKSRGLRSWLDQHGFEQTELHLNEWNYLPDNDWSAISPQCNPEERARWYARMGGVEGAVFLASVLTRLQDTPLDVANLYSSDSSPFGLFERTGVPKRTYYAVLAFAELLQTPNRLTATSATPGVDVLAGLNERADELRVLVTCRERLSEPLQIDVANVPWVGRVQVETRTVSDRSNLEPLPAAENAVRVPSAGTIHYVTHSEHITLVTMKRLD